VAEPTTTELISGEAGSEQITVTPKPVTSPAVLNDDPELLPSAGELFGDDAPAVQPAQTADAAAELPTSEELFGLPTAEELFGEEPSSMDWPTDGESLAVAVPRLPLTEEERDLANEIANRSGVTNILHQMGEAISDGWGEADLGLSPESEKWLRENGLLTGVEASHLDLRREISEAIIRPTAMAVEVFLRSFSSLTRGVGALGGGVAEETGLAKAVGLPSSQLERELVQLSEVILVLAGSTPGAMGSGGALQTARMSSKQAQKLARETKRDIKEFRKPGALEEQPIPHSQRPFDDLAPADPTPVKQQTGPQATATGRKSARQEAIDAAAAPEPKPAAAPEAAAPKVEPTSTRAKDYAESGQYDVVLSDGSTVKIYRDTEQFSYPVWHRVGDEGNPAGIGFTKKEALEMLESGVAKADAATPTPAAAAAAKSAAAEGPKPSVATEAAPLTDKAGNINLNRIEAPEDVLDIIRNVARENDDFIGPRRGVITLEETKELAEALGMTFKELMKRKVGQAFNSEELLAARNLNIQAAADSAARSRVFVNAVEDAKAGGSLDAVAAARNDLAAAVERHTLIQEQVAGASTEAGRAQSAMRIAAEANRKANDIGDAAAEALATGNLDKLAHVLAKADNPAEAARKMLKWRRTRPSDMAGEWWTNMLLSSPNTHGINLVSNVFTALLRVPETSIAAGVGKARRSAAGDRVMIGEVGPILQGLISGALHGLRPAVRTFFTEASSGKFARTSKLDVKNRKSIPSYTVPGVSVKGVPLELGGKQIRIPGRALLASDEILKSANYVAEINALAYRMAVKQTGKTSGAKFEEVFKGLVNNPSKQMQRKALDTAEYNTFTRRLEGFSSQVVKFTTQHPVTKLVAPFITTPLNLLKFGSERTVFSLASKKTRDIIRGKDKVAADQEIAKLIMGSMVSTAVVSLVLTGDITGSGPLNFEERRLWMAAGNRPNSFKIAGQWYSYDRWNPIGIIMTLTADLVAAGQNTWDKDYDEAAVRLVKLTSGFVFDNTWAQGVSKAIEAIADPDIKGADYIRNMVSTMIVPQGLAAIAREMDPLVRETETFIDKLRSKIPGLSDDLTPKYDVFGRTISRDEKVGGVMMSPIKVSPESVDPAFAEMQALEVFPTTVPEKIDNIELTPDEYAQYARLSGELLRQSIQRFMSLDGYYKIPPTIRKERFGFFVKESRDLAKKQVRNSHRRLFTARAEAIMEETELLLDEINVIEKQEVE
tara:strand:+ start:885 stop:4580 length:3696 start_codon:yes stop_codon:yes gene_type:complete